MEPVDQRGVVRDVCCKDVVVSRGRQGRGGSEEGREGVVRVGAPEGETVGGVACVGVVVRAADPGDPGRTRAGHTDGCVTLTCGDAGDGSVGAACADPCEDFKRHARAGRGTGDLQGRVIEAGDGRDGDSGLGIDGIRVGQTRKRAGVGRVDVLDARLCGMRTERLSVTARSVICLVLHGESSLPEERDIALGPGGTLHCSIHIEPSDKVRRVAGYVKCGQEKSRSDVGA